MSTLLKQLLDFIYPIGSIYQSTKNISPATFLGGTWKQLKGTFLYAATSGVSHPGVEDNTDETIINDGGSK